MPSAWKCSQPLRPGSPAIAPLNGNLPSRKENPAHACGAGYNGPAALSDLLLILFRDACLGIVSRLRPAVGCSQLLF